MDVAASRSIELQGASSYREKAWKAEAAKRVQSVYRGFSVRSADKEERRRLWLEFYLDPEISELDAAAALAVHLDTSRDYQWRGRGTATVTAFGRAVCVGGLSVTGPGQSPYVGG